ncbi:MAG: thiamine-monophosphate kinase [Phenylobacterium sp.]|jgi:thiamine-monophosphate kinase
MKEFELIKRYFAAQQLSRKDVEVGIGDDAAIINVPENSQLVVTTDTLNVGVHFFENIDPAALGHRAVAVNLSDIAAMGADPAWISIAITLPQVDEAWIKAFTDGIFEICEYYNVQVIGGDTTQGPLSITITAHGLVPKGKAITRCGAKPGDWIYVTGTVGDAGVAIDAIKNNLTLPLKYQKSIYNRFDYPTPRVAFAQALREIASSAIDISDGLLADLGHIVDKSKVGAVLNLEQLPLSDALKGSVDESRYLEFALTAGDDYELLFTVPEDRRGALDVGMAHYGIKLTCIGQVMGQAGRIELRYDNKPFEFDSPTGFEHFAGVAGSNEASDEQP